MAATKKKATTPATADAHTPAPAETPAPAPKEKVKPAPKETVKAKFNTGDIVFINQEADADLNGFKLFPQYKKYTYRVEAYDDRTSTYSIRRLNLSLKLKEADILAPSEKSSSSLIRKRF